jgi:elongation factor P--beta-lysine ligase
MTGHNCDATSPYHRTAICFNTIHMVCCKVAKGFSAALMLSQPAAGVIVGLHRLVMAHVRNHDDADKLSAIITCTI